MKWKTRELVRRLSLLDPSRMMVGQLLELAAQEDWGESIPLLTLSELSRMWQLASALPPEPQPPNLKKRSRAGRPPRVKRDGSRRRRGVEPKPPRAVEPRHPRAVEPRHPRAVDSRHLKAVESVVARPTARPPLSARVLDFLLEEPWCTAERLSKELGVDLFELWGALSSLVSGGQVRTIESQEGVRYGLG